MKIFTAEQIRKADAFTIENEPVSSVNLMERAALACVSWLLNHSKNNEKFVIFCGYGNNGGDGFAMARMLYQKGFEITVFIDFQNAEKFSADAKINYNRLREISGIEIFDFDEVSNFDFSDKTIIDALLGTGLSRKIEGKIRELIVFLNNLPNRKISVDLPSGLYADRNTEENSTIFQADETLSFQFWKKAFLHPESGKYAGKIHILDIGLSGKFIHETKTAEYIICEKLIKTVYKPRPDFSHKGNFGKTCIIAGSFGKIGAAVLATKAALRTGSGLTFTLAPKCGYEILQSACPEAMFLYGGEDFVSHFEVEEYFVCGIGPGLGTDPETEEAFITFLEKYEKPLVLDADALNIIAKEENSIAHIPKNSVITPHPKEFERLFGKSANSFERLEIAKKHSRELEIVIVLKDHHTQIIKPSGKVFYNITGNSGMAKGGSGDVLTGIITSLLSQNYSSEEAAIFGVWLHGKAGDLAAEKYSRESMLPSEIIDELSAAFKFIAE